MKIKKYTKLFQKLFIFINIVSHIYLNIILIKTKHMFLLNEL